MRSVDLKVNLFKEAADIKVCFTDIGLSQAIGNLTDFVKLKCLDSTFWKSKSLKWAKAIIRFIDIINNHYRVSEIAICVNHLKQISVWEGKT